MERNPRIKAVDFISQFEGLIGDYNDLEHTDTLSSTAKTTDFFNASRVGSCPGRSG